MNTLLIALLAVLLVPLFVATWRTSLLGLGCQGLGIAWIAFRIRPDAASSLAFWLTAFDLGFVRGVLVPLSFYRLLEARRTPARNDVIPPNLLSWTIALGLVLLSFLFAEQLVTRSGDEQTLVAVATAGVLLGFLVLATQSSPFTQVVGALRIENAIALLELGGRAEHLPALVRVLFSAAFVATFALFRWHLSALTLAADPTSERDGSRGVTL